MIARLMRVKDLSDMLRKEIVSSKFVSGTPILSAKEMAKKYDTSVLTAHRAIKALADEKLIYRVRGSGSFVSENDKKHKSYRVGISVFAETGENAAIYAAFDCLYKTVSDSLKSQGQQIEYLQYDDLLSGTDLSKYDAFVVSSSYLDKQTINNLKKTKCPVVVVQHTDIMDCPFHQVLPDISSGFEQAFQLLTDKGHDKIMAVYSTGNSRYQSLINNAMKAGFEKDKILYFPVDPIVGDLGRMGGYNAGRKISELKGPKAVFSTSDFLSFGIIDALREKGLKAGSDYDLISFDDLEGSGWQPFNEPFLSSVSFPRKKVAQYASELILSQLKKATEYSVILRLPTELVIRKSCPDKK